MNWKLIDKSNTDQPKKGNYNEWKEILATEGYYQCVYCSIKDGRFGGIRQFHVEHFKPKSKFPELKNDIKNLYYACPVCNTFKGDDWIEEDASSRAYYPNPSLVNYNELFVVDARGFLAGTNNVGDYLQHKLALNRLQLVYDRRLVILRSALNFEISRYERLVKELMNIGNGRALEFLRSLFEAGQKVQSVKDEIMEGPSYTMEGTRRSS